MIRRSKKEESEEYSHLESVLLDIPRFISKHHELSYIEFDYYTVQDLTLFSVEPDFDFLAFERTINKIDKALPAIKRVFSKPFIVLKDTADVLPVEVVTKINQNTLAYLGNHTNTVSNITSKGIKPRKLLTQVYEDDYGIYENLVFCDFIDAVIRYCRRNMRTLRQLVYASQTMEFNLLERVNHLDYFLALGKLHTGYIRDFNKYYARSKELYKKTKQILNTLQSRLIKPVYKKNNRRGNPLPLKKTNIFLMQKNYHQVYVAYKSLLSNTNKKIKVEKEEVDLDKLKESYYSYLKILSIFALGHFNFTIRSTKKIDLLKLNSTFRFKDWYIRLFDYRKAGLLITVSKDVNYRMLLVPSVNINPEPDLLKLKDKYDVDEVVICSPFDSGYSNSISSFISIENIDSFRRIQQLFLKGMIYSDLAHTDCPFCKGDLNKTKEEGVYQCDDCRTVIKEKTCPTTKENYYVTDIYGLPKKHIDPAAFNYDDTWLYEQEVESSKYFRNITKVDQDGNPICPICHKVHAH